MLSALKMWPAWARTGARAWHHEHEVVIESADERGVVLAQYRRHLNPSRRLLTPKEAARALEFGELRPNQPAVRRNDGPE
jgi:hypothetical protein